MSDWPDQHIAVGNHHAFRIPESLIPIRERWRRLGGIQQRSRRIDQRPSAGTSVGLRIENLRGSPIGLAEQALIIVLATGHKNRAVLQNVRGVKFTLVMR